MNNFGQGGQFLENEWYVVRQQLIAVVKEGRQHRREILRADFTAGVLVLTNILLFNVVPYLYHDRVVMIIRVS